MTRLKLFAASLAAATMVMIPGANAETAAAEEPTKGEVKLAKMLKGRVAGEAQRCILGYRQVDLTVIDGTALVYRSGRTLYVNVPKNPRSLDDRDILVRRTTMGNQLCNTDIISKTDSSGRFYAGNVLLGDFVPYRKAETES